MKLKIGDTEVEGVVVQFEAMQEPWSMYRLEDGTTVRVKLVVTQMIRLPSNDPVTGLPQYLINSGNVAAIEPPSPPGKKN